MNSCRTTNFQLMRYYRCNCVNPAYPAAFNWQSALTPSETDMKKMKLMCMALMLLGSVPAGPVWANSGGHHRHNGHHNHGHHRHHHSGGGWGAGYGAVVGAGVIGYGLGSFFGTRPYYGYPAGGFAPAYGYAPANGYAPAYGYAPVVAAPVAPPPVYIQRQDVVQAQPQSSNYWHYCRNPEGYYPYIKSCPKGWLQVVPQ